jgi:CRISPR-associated protein Cas1
MVTLYISRNDGLLGKQGEALTYRKDRQTASERVPARLVDDVVMLGNASVSTQAIHMMLENNIPLHFIDEQGRYKGSLTSGRGRGYALRRAQMNAAFEPDSVLEITKSIVSGKLRNQLSTLKRGLWRGRSDDVILRRACLELKKMLNSLPECMSTDASRGIEGSAAAVYFSVFDRLLRKPWFFRERNRRPPKDPINALLSFGYTLLLSHVTSAVIISGLDPCVGFLHPEFRGRPSLALDLMEEYRSPVVDRLVLSVANQMIINPNGFAQTEDGGVMMNAETRKTFVRSYLERISERTKDGVGITSTYRNHIFSSAVKFASSLRNGTKYIPFHFAE